jgi:hypothetical protein
MQVNDVSKLIVDRFTTSTKNFSGRWLRLSPKKTGWPVSNALKLGIPGSPPRHVAEDTDFVIFFRERHPETGYSRAADDPQSNERAGFRFSAGQEENP